MLHRDAFFTASERILSADADISTSRRIHLPLHLHIFRRSHAILLGEAFGEITKLLEENMKRSLSPLEIDMISEWFNEDVDKNVIINSINECIMKHNKVTVKMVDKLIIKNLAHTDRVEEGFSTVDEKTKKDIKKAMDIASYDWVNRDDK